MKLKKNIALSESGFVFNPSNGDSFSCNPVGLEILQLMEKKLKPTEIYTHLSKNYLVEKSVFEKDFADFLLMLERLKLSE